MKDRCWPTEGHPRPLILIDIAQPRDVEDGAGTVDGVRLFTIDDLRTVNEQAMGSRRAEAERAHGFVEAELSQSFCATSTGRPPMTSLPRSTRGRRPYRVRERERAITRLGTVDMKTAGIVDNLARVLTKKLLTDATFAIRSSAEEGDLAAAEALVKAITQGDRIEGQPPKE